MVIHFSATSDNIKNSVKIYRKICSIIKEQGHTLARDWVEEAFEHADKTYTQPEAQRIAQLTREAIKNCDLAIFEVTRQSFSVGYQAAISVSLQKPILFIQKYHSEDIGILGMVDATILKSFKWYKDTDELACIIKDFIDKNSLSKKDLRFNMMLDRRTLKYIDNESSRTGISKSQVVRKLIEQEADRKNQI